MGLQDGKAKSAWSGRGIVALGAGIGIIFGSAFGAPGIGMVIGAAIGLGGGFLRT